MKRAVMLLALLLAASAIAHEGIRLTGSGDLTTYVGDSSISYPKLCSYSLSAASASATYAGTSDTVDVTAGSGCPWTAVSNDAWITVDSGSPGSGDGTVGYTVAVLDGAGRSGTITIAGQTFTVTQTSSLLNGLVAYWPMTEASGNRVDVIGSVALAPTGTVSTTTAPGGSGNAVLFTGAAASNLNSTNAVFSLGDATYTWGALIKLTDLEAEYWTLAKEGGNLEYSFSNRAYTSDDRVVFRVWSTTTNKDAKADNYGGPPRGFWLRILGWHNSTADTANVRVGLDTANSLAMGNPARASGAVAFNVGSRVFGAEIAKLAVSHLGLWNRVLSTAEQTAIQARVYPFGATDTVNIPAYPESWVAFGDSKTLDDTWQKKWRSLIDGVTTVKIATSGATTASRASTIAADLAALAHQDRDTPGIMYELGTNDLPGVKAGTLTEGAWTTNFNTIVNAMIAKWPTIVIYLNRPWQRDHGAAADTYAGWLATKIAANPTHLAAGPDERVWLENGDNGTTYTDDGIHPNAAGKQVEATQWKTATGH